MRNDEIAEVLDTLQGALVDKLTAWEIDFIESVAGQYATRGWLSEKQKTTLDDIFEKCQTRGGRRG